MSDESVVAWVRSKAIPLATVEPRHGFADLEQLRSIVGEARILSLGEATHGTREFFKLKHRIVEFCVAELGFTTFIIEAGFAETLAVNAYVLHGVGNAADALAGMRLWVWDTEEVLDLIEWMRWWNRTHLRQVTFYGYSMTDTTAAVRGLIDFLARVAPELAADCRIELAPLASDVTAALFCDRPGACRDAVSAGIAAILAAFFQHRETWTAATSGTDWHVGRLHAVVLDQSVRFLALHRSFSFHERSAAENVRALLDVDGPEARALLWSHNGHAARATDPQDGLSMGMCLDEMFGRAQRVIGFSFDRGSFQARTYQTGELADHELPPAALGTFDAVLAQAGSPLFALDLAGGPRDGAAGAWLASETEMRSIGGIYGLPPDNAYGATYTAPITPRQTFDAVVFVAETSPARRNQPSPPGPPLVVLPAPANLALSGEGIPTGWRRLGRGRTYDGAIVGSDEPSPRCGRTVRLSRDAPWAGGECRLVQTISARRWHGQRLRFSAALRTEAEDVGSGALLLLQIPKIQPGDRSDFFAPPSVTSLSCAYPWQSTQWVTATVEIDVPETAKAVLIGLVMTGNGAAWFGDLDLATIAGVGEAAKSGIESRA